MEKAFQKLDDWLAVEKMPNGKKRVLRAAMTLFSQQGYDGTSTAQIAELSQMSQATIFKYFKSKEDLLLFIIKPMIEHILPAYGKSFAQQLQGSGDDLASLVHFIVFDRYQFLVQNKDVAIILISQLLINDEIKNMLFEEIQSMKDIFIDNVWQPLVKTRELRDDLDLLQFLRTVIGQILLYFLQSQRILQIDDQQQIESDLLKIERSIILAVKK
ncbi:TetR/AcrR family transcriptional regulator [Companilactobacillus sp. HBUAS56275]|uniref:TetR/AcrR family transcriptional regulator n=1 Tax=Candidatus Companilactobacillus pullicola TaxID=2838523 RepID=A0A9D1ZQ05_9LACO|nr:TetR/AcrR family transcriptional regulator [Candidatus Companilactobacillus pullicola]